MGARPGTTHGTGRLPYRSTAHVWRAPAGISVLELQFSSTSIAAAMEGRCSQTAQQQLLKQQVTINSQSHAPHTETAGGRPWAAGAARPSPSRAPPKLKRSTAAVHCMPFIRISGAALQIQEAGSAPLFAKRPSCEAVGRPCWGRPAPPQQMEGRAITAARLELGSVRWRGSTCRQ